MLDIVRQAVEPMTTCDIGFQLLMERALDENDQKLVRLISKRGGVALRWQRELGVVACRQRSSQYMLWELAQDG